jgi:hypothetical protein
MRALCGVLILVAAAACSSGDDQSSTATGSSSSGDAVTTSDGELDGGPTGSETTGDDVATTRGSTDSDGGSASGEPTDGEDADVSVAQDTPAPEDTSGPPQSCVTGNDTCPPGQFCRSPHCNDGMSGTCVPFPAECPEIYQPICSCADVSFDNACLSYQAGVNIAANGLCEGELLGCIVEGFETCPKGWYCRGTKCGDSPGECQEKPTTCDDEDAPVCGCDAVTYSNACEAAMNGVSLKFTWKCVPKEGAACGGDTGKECLADQGCNVIGCEDAKPGKCKNYTKFCFGGVQCGCDGVTYDDYCKRMDAGAAQKHDGPCLPDGSLPVCELSENKAACEGSLFCKGAPGACEGEGMCTAMPPLCAGWLGKKVCACDGQTYDSPCHAQQAGAPISSSLGACAP